MYCWNAVTWARLVSEVNVEHSMSLNGSLGGHIVQGHADQMVRCIDVQYQYGSSRCSFPGCSSDDVIFF
ncbi:MAG: hypothetical protein IJR87_08280 [Bacteroidaceae bacterium]|nr:hypothetical protein [Bacteroidaceae bacterium]